MYYENLKQAARCNNIISNVRTFRTRAGEMRGHAERLESDIGLRERLIDDLQRQSECTGDPESFAFDIRRAGESIRNLKRQALAARGNEQEFRVKMQDAIRDYHSNGCGGSIGV